MPKPSIFSNQYDRQMKKRKKIITGITITVVLGLLIVGGFATGIFKGRKISFNVITQKINGVKDKKSHKTPSNPAVQKPNNSNTKDKPKVEEKPKPVEENIEVKLSDGTSIKAIYEGNNGEKRFKYLDNNYPDMTSTISPSGKGMLIYYGKTQSIIYANVDGTSVDITNPKYISTKGNVYTKEEKIKNNSNYIWCRMPMFIDENTVAYVSQLPWLKEGKPFYVWYVNVKDKNSHNRLDELKGTDIKFGPITDKGLTVIIDGNKKYLNSSGTITGE